MKKTTKSVSMPLIIEKHPDNYDGYPFITLVQYRKQHVLSIIDNADDKCLRLFVLDLCGPTNVNEERVIDVATQWWDNGKERYPISFEFSRQGLINDFSKIYRSFNIEYVARVVGPLFVYNMNNTHSVKRRKRKLSLNLTWD